jgi:hypothetical protein
LDLGPQPGEAPWPTLEELSRLPGQIPGNRYRGQDLAALVAWGTGATNVAAPGTLPQAIQSITTLTRAYVVASGITLREAEQWAYAYAVEATQYPNPSAYPRSQLLWCIVKLLRNVNEHATGPDCCGDELDYRPPQGLPLPPRGWRGRT